MASEAKSLIIGVVRTMRVTRKTSETSARWMASGGIHQEPSAERRRGWFLFEVLMPVLIQRSPSSSRTTTGSSSTVSALSSNGVETTAPLRLPPLPVRTLP